MEWTVRRSTPQQNRNINLAKTEDQIPNQVPSCQANNRRFFPRNMRCSDEIRLATDYPRRDRERRSTRKNCNRTDGERETTMDEAEEDGKGEERDICIGMQALGWDRAACSGERVHAAHVSTLTREIYKEGSQHAFPRGGPSRIAWTRVPPIDYLWARAPPIEFLDFRPEVPGIFTRLTLGRREML